jgi:hypothetical protein
VSNRKILAAAFNIVDADDGLADGGEPQRTEAANVILDEWQFL